MKAADRKGQPSASDHRDTPPEDDSGVAAGLLAPGRRFGLPSRMPSFQSGGPVADETKARRYSCGGSSGFADDLTIARRTGFPLSSQTLRSRRTVTTTSGMSARFASIGG